jgi:outer membrane lipopolysaccharide assembly protein LptE/RlpB
MRKLLMIAAVSLLAACGHKISGTYSASTPLGRTSISFDGDGHATLSTLGQALDAEYRGPESGQVRVVFNGQVLMLEILQDGNLRDSTGMIYTKS